MIKLNLLQAFKLPFIFVVIFICLFISLVYFVFSKQSQLNLASKQLHDLKLSYQDQIDVNFFDWTGPITTDYLALTPSLLPIIRTDKLVTLSCLDMPAQRHLKDIQNSIKNLSLLENGLKYIENYEFTTNLQDDKGNKLDPIISRHDIVYNKICKLSNDTTKSNGSYIVLFLSQGENKNKATSFIPQAYAAGGWLGNSHFALITDNSVKIYENFTIIGTLIPLQKQGEKPVLLRFGAYYNCSDISLATDKHFIIVCSGNQYVFNRQDETFKEIGICGPIVDKGVYTTSKFACYDGNGSQYYYRETSLE